MLASLKSAIRPFVPAPVRRAWQRAHFALEQRAVAGKPLEEVFTEIYETAAWSPEHAGTYHSGPGSLPQVTTTYECFVADLINGDPKITRLVDVGCGDFQVAGRILARLERPISYVGLDIAKNVVAFNQANHARPGVEFLHLDVTRTVPPAGDLVTVREVFQHLSNDAILAALGNLRQRFDRALVTEAVPRAPKKPNMDIFSGYRTRVGLGSGVFLELPPFNLEVLSSFEVPISDQHMLRTLLVRL
jgi:SAM-dependent methyltransferase